MPRPPPRGVPSRWKAASQELMVHASSRPAAPSARRASATLRVAILALVLGAILVSFTAVLAHPAAQPAIAAAFAAPTGSPIPLGPIEPGPSKTVASPGPTGPDPSPGPTPQPVCSRPPAGATPAVLVHHGSRDTKIVALTFDDGWVPANVGRILGILEKAKVNATFFPVGTAIKTAPAAWKAVAAAGFPIGNHTYDHRRLTELCYEDQL